MGKTIFVLLDACGYEIATENMGYLEHMVDYNLAAKYKIQGELPSMSRPMYETLLTGTVPYMHGITCNEVVRLSNRESVFGLCRKAGLKTGAAAYSWISELYNWVPFNRFSDRIQINREEGLIDYGVYYWEDSYPDSHLFSDGEFIRKTYSPDFMMYHPMSIDLAGHTFGSDSNEYAERVASMGYLVADLIPGWLNDGYQIVISADHGMDPKGIHCGTTAVQRDVPLYIFSPLVETGRFEDNYTSHRNVAPLLCRLLGIPAGADMISLNEIKFK